MREVASVQGISLHIPPPPHSSPTAAQLLLPPCLTFPPHSFPRGDQQHFVRRDELRGSCFAHPHPYMLHRASHSGVTSNTLSGGTS